MDSPIREERTPSLKEYIFASEDLKDELPASVSITKVQSGDDTANGILSCSVYRPPRGFQTDPEDKPLIQENQTACQEVMQFLGKTSLLEQFLGEQGTKDLPCDRHSLLEKISQQILDHFTAHEIFETCLRPVNPVKYKTAEGTNKPLHSSSKVKSCQECGYSTTKRSNFERHLNSHRTRQKKVAYDLIAGNRLECQGCCRKFADFWQLTAHACIGEIQRDSDRRRSQSQVIHMCEQCGYKSSRKGNLELHMRSHAEKHETHEKPNQNTRLDCGQCGSSYSTKKRLREHERTHEYHKNDALYSCSLCDYKCNKKGNLKLHLRIHNPTKRYKCRLCDYRCNFKSCLDAHMRKHTGERPFTCNICQKGFRQKKHLIVHQKNHNKSKDI